MSALLERLLDRVNPILVKEVRQAVRGKLFRFGFFLTLFAALSVSLVMLIADWGGGDDAIGPALAIAIFGCLLAATIAWVPFAAFVSMGSEWDENTLDLLLLSNLKPRRIVYGKLGSAWVQTLVYFSAFTPFFVFAFLLRGVNFPSLLLMLAGALFVSPCVSLIALGISSLTPLRFLRVLLMVLLAAGLVMLTVSGIVLATFGMGSSYFGPTPEQLVLAVGASSSVALVVGLFFGEVACGRLSHPEENRSTGLRLAVLLALAGAIAWCAVALAYDAPADIVNGTAIAALFGLVLPCAVFASEPDRLGRRVAMHVPRNPVLALLVAPFLPGGGRGMLFWLLLNALLAAALAGVAIVGLDGPVAARLPKLADQGLTPALATVVYCLLYLGVPTLLFARIAHTLRGRVIARVAVPLFALVTILGPSVVSFLVSGADDTVFKHWLNPFWVLDKAWNGRTAIVGERFEYSLSGSFGVVLLLSAGAILLINTRRMVRGVREVLEASRARRLRESAAAARPVPAVSASDAPAAG